METLEACTKIVPVVQEDRTDWLNVVIKTPLTVVVAIWRAGAKRGGTLEYVHVLIERFS